MFLSRRSLQAEYFDQPDLPLSELQLNYEHLRTINRIFYLRDCFQRYIPRLLKVENCKSLTLLDLGAGDGSLGRDLESWSRRRGWNWAVTNLDLNHSLARTFPGQWICGSVLDLPLKNRSFDVVISSQMFHHFNKDQEIIRAFSEAWRVAGKAVLLNDLHRNLILYALLNGLLRAGMFPRTFREDGLISVRKGFRVPEWREFAQQAQIPQPKVWLYFGARVMLWASKTGE